MLNPPDVHRFSHEAMNTRFDLAMAGVERDIASGAAHEAFLDIDRLESELSRFQPDSDIARLRNLADGQSTRVGLATLDCLCLALDVHAATGGAFDVTIAPLVEVWRAAGDSQTPDPDQLNQAATVCGSDRLEVDLERLEVKARAPGGLHLDLGGIGKGYALDQSAEILGRWEVRSALLNAGDSTVLALGPPPGSNGWAVGPDLPGISFPPLAQGALSGSGFSVQGAHVIDPRTRQPVPRTPEKEHVWATAPTAALADALSTAFMVMGENEIAQFCRKHPETGFRLSPTGQ